MSPEVRSGFYRMAAVTFVVVGLTQCDRNTAEQGSYDNVQLACLDGGEAVTKGYHELASESSALKFQFDLIYDKCIATEKFTDKGTNKTCLLKLTYDGPLVYTYSYIPSDESFNFELNLNSPQPLFLSINEKKYEIQFKDFKSIGNESQKTYAGSIVVDGVEYAADKLIKFVEDGMIFCP